jgi:hypothetical protein
LHIFAEEGAGENEEIEGEDEETEGGGESIRDKLKMLH